MITDLLQQRFPSEYGLPADNIVVSAQTCSGYYVLSDDKACGQCRDSRPERRCCNGENLRIEFDENNIVLVDFENYISQYEHTAAEISERCDYLFVDDECHTKIAFCDLTCSDMKYVVPNKGLYKLGKRAKAVAQMTNSLECLLNVPLLDHYMLTFPVKVCLFGWRDYASEKMETDGGNVERSIAEFMRTPSSMARLLQWEVPVIGHGFEFVQVKYPDVYVW